MFISTVIYIGIHEEPEISMYWNTDFNKGPLHLIPSHISLHRFSQSKDSVISLVLIQMKGRV